MKHPNVDRLYNVCHICSSLGYNGLKIMDQGMQLQSATPIGLTVLPIQPSANVQNNSDAAAVQGLFLIVILLNLYVCVIFFLFHSPCFFFFSSDFFSKSFTFFSEGLHFFSFLTLAFHLLIFYFCLHFAFAYILFLVNSQALLIQIE